MSYINSIYFKIRLNYEYSGSNNRRPVSSVGRVPDYRAGRRGFKPRPDQHSGSLNN